MLYQVEKPRAGEKLDALDGKIDGARAGSASRREIAPRSMSVALMSCNREAVELLNTDSVRKLHWKLSRHKVESWGKDVHGGEGEEFR
jgi:hypothetical protein